MYACGYVIHILANGLTHIDLYVAVMCDDMQHCAKKGREKEECQLVNMDVNNVRFNTVKTWALLMF